MDNQDILKNLLRVRQLTSEHTPGQVSPYTQSATELSNALRKLLSDCENDLGGGSAMATPLSTVWKMSSFSALHSLLGNKCAVMSLFDIVLSSRSSSCLPAGAGPSPQLPWLNEFRRVAEVSTDSHIVQHPTSQDATLDGSEAMADATLTLCKSIVLLLSNGIIALQGAHAFTSHFTQPSPLATSLMLALCEGLGSTGHPATPFLGQLIRVLTKLKPFVAPCFQMTADVRAAGTSETSAIHELLRNALTNDACAAYEVWACLRGILFANKALTSTFIIEQFNDYVACFINILSANKFSIGMGGWYVGCCQSLKLLSGTLGDPLFGKARTKLADCPALLASILGVLDAVQQRRMALPRSDQPTSLMDITSHNARQGLAPSDAITHDSLLLHEIYHSLKVYIAKPKKALSVRFLLTSNRDALLPFIQDYHTACRFGNDGEGESDGASLLQREAERRLLVASLCQTAALDTNELYTLKHFIDVDAVY